MNILILDNYDSFTYNLVQAFQKEGCGVDVRRNDALTVEQIRKLNYDAIVISPGPGNPENKRDFGVCGEVLQEISPDTPTLGICLGHQGIVQTFGGKVKRAPEPRHGKNSLIRHEGDALFEGVANPFSATRYHSLVGEIREHGQLIPIAFSTDDNQLMAVKHRRFPIFGLQFHPEAILTGEGQKIIRNFMREARR